MTNEELNQIVNEVISRLQTSGTNVGSSATANVANTNYLLALAGNAIKRVASTEITTLQGNVTTAQGDITTLQGKMTSVETDIDAIQDQVFEVMDVDLLSEGSFTQKWISRKVANIGELEQSWGGIFVYVYKIGTGKIKLRFEGNAVAAQGMAAAFYDTDVLSAIGHDTFIESALYEQDGTTTQSVNADLYGNDYEIEVPEGAKAIALTVASTTTVYITQEVEGGKVVALETEVEELTNRDTKPLERNNLFSIDNVETGKIVDVSSGVVANWDAGTRGEYAAVAKIDITRGNYYAIINPYWREAIVRAGVSRNKADTTHDYGNTTADNIVYAGRHYAVVQAICVRAQTAAIDTLNFQLYRTSNKVPYPIETPMVEVYEMSSASEAIAYIKSRFDENREIQDTLNLDRKLLDSDHVGTLSSMFNDKSMLVMGDSITAHHAWSDYIANKFKWHGIHNIAIGGANISGSYNVTSGVQRNLIYQMLNAASLLGDVCYVEGEYDETTNKYIKKIDCVMISMGYNDAANGYACGTPENVFAATWSSLAPADNDTVFASIAAAIKYCLFYMKTTLIDGTFTVGGNSINVALDCRNAKFVWQTPIATSNVFSPAAYNTPELTDARLRDVEDTIVAMCEHYSVSVINGRLKCGFTREEEMLAGGKYLTDNVHPTDIGYIKMGEMNASGLLSNFI